MVCNIRDEALKIITILISQNKKKQTTVPSCFARAVEVANICLLCMGARDNVEGGKKIFFWFKSLSNIDIKL